MLRLLPTGRTWGRAVWLCALGHFGCHAFNHPLEPDVLDDGFDQTAGGSTASTGGAEGGIGMGAGADGSGPNLDPDMDQLDTLTELALGLDPNDPDTNGDGCTDFFEPDFPECNGNDLFTLTCLTQDAQVTVFVNPESSATGNAKFQLDPLTEDDSHPGGGGGAGPDASPIPLLSSADGAPLAKQTSFDLQEELRQLHLVTPSAPDALVDPDYQAAGERSHKLRVSLVSASDNEVLASWNVYARRCD